MVRAGVAACSTNSLIVDVYVVTSCASASITPSGPAPSRTRWMVGGRCPTSAGSWERCSASLTGRPTCRAAIAASTGCGRGVPLEPKPPPTCSLMTVTCAGSMAKSAASVSRTALDPWLESCTVSRPSFQWATAACGSMGWLCIGSIEYVTSTVTGAAA